MTFVTIELDRPRRLRLDFNALCDLEGHLGMPFQEAFSPEHAGLRTMRGVLWAGMKPFDPTLTPERTGKILEDYLKSKGSTDQIAEKISEALVLSGLISQNDEVPEGNENGPV